MRITRLVADRNLLGNTIDLYLFQRSESGDHFSGRPIEVGPQDPNVAAFPITRISRNEAQELLDSLWHCGLRPTDAGESTGELAATKKHLEDIRNIAFFKLEIPLPK